MSSTSSSARPQVIGAFLSHSYGAPEVNLFFYELNSKIATITFRVDRGKFALSTTRLERMIRDADMFVGVYFSETAKRKQLVFLSYAGEDAAIGQQFAAALQKRFQEVFNYRDDSSLNIGEYWQDQIARKLSVTAIGVILFSKHYGHSGYCMDEARDLYDGFVNGRANLLPVKLDETRVPRPLSRLQYARVSQGTPAEIVERFVRELGYEIMARGRGARS